MYIQKVWIENIRCFGAGAQKAELDLQRSDGSYAGWTVVAGPNGTGKSTFLRALALAVTGHQFARAFQMGFAGWIRQGAPWGYMGVELGFDDADRFTVGKRPEAPFWADLVLHRQVDGPEPDITTKAQPDEGPDPVQVELVAYEAILRPKGAERGPWAANPQGWFLAAYGPFRRLSGGSTEGERLMSGPGRIARVVSLFRTDASLAQAAEWLRFTHLRCLEKKPGAKELEEGILGLLNDDLLPDEMKIVRVDSEGIWTQRKGTEILLDDLSDGYSSVVALVLDLVKQLHACFGTLQIETQEKGRAILHRGVVLIDEADMHLHPSWQQKIGFWFKSRFPNIQFIVTTHSPFICQAADSKGLIRLPKPGSIEHAAHVSEELFRLIVNGGADDVAMSDLFGLERPHSDRSEAARQRVAELEAKLIRNRATSEEEAELLRLRQELPNTGSMSLELTLRAARASHPEIRSWP